MCAVYQPAINTAWIQQQFDVAWPRIDQAVYPGQNGAILVRSRTSGRMAAGLARFGMIAPWAKDTKWSRHTYNARAETVATKPSFRDAWRSEQFGVVLADSFCEPNYESGRAVRWQIKAADGEPFGIASLWQRWTDPSSGIVVVSFTMLTINADGHPVMGRFHRPDDEKRTPLILPQAAIDGWLTATTQSALEALNLATLPELVCEPAPTARLHT